MIAIPELGGGYNLDDVKKYFSRVGLLAPEIEEVSVDPGAVNSPGSPADAEVALDAQVAGASYARATGQPAKIRIYWANADVGGIQRCYTRAAADGCDVFSCSWGADEAVWGRLAASQAQTAAMAATAWGMVLLAAAGDNDSSDGGPGRSNVDLPAGLPSFIGCGGTNRPRNSNQITGPQETVWQNNPGQTTGEGTGGGFSAFFGIQSWQIGAPTPPSGRGRMVPDIAANADPVTGYHIILNGQDIAVGGTSAVAPLYAGLIAACGRKLGFITPKLWLPANRGIWRDIGQGENGAFQALPGQPDPCTGLGTPHGALLAALLMGQPIA